MKLALSLAISAFWLGVLQWGWPGQLPALGPLFDFKSGVWQHKPFQLKSRPLPGLRAPVEVAFDAHGVPHLFAENEHDLFIAQGYVVATQRLFQMELYTRSTTGQVGELVGARGLPLDEFFVKFGMRRAERLTRDLILADPATRSTVDAYLLGVNAHIEDVQHNTSLKNIEYRLLEHTPVKQTAAMVSSMAKTMTYSLSGAASDLHLTRLQRQLSNAQILDLFPEFLPSEFEDVVFPQLKGPGSRPKETPALFDTFKSSIQHLPEFPMPPTYNGSNNWAVGPKKSTTGYSILANDTHLGLTLPNVWFEIQLSCPEFNVYGVGFANIPGIVNGFNVNVAWGPTNGTTDVLDYYEIRFADATSLRYQANGEWLDAELDKEIVSTKFGPSYTLEVPWTIWGPVVAREGNIGLVAHWTGHKPSNELSVLRKLYRSRSAKECLNIFENWQVPIQNFVCADSTSIGMGHFGRIPKRQVGSGRFVESPSSENAEYLAVPQVYNPPEGYLRSANQRILGQTHSMYMGWNFEDPFRGRRIRQLLESTDRFSGEEIVTMQNDNLDAEAELILPLLLQHLSLHNFSSKKLELVDKLKQWDFRALAVSIEPTLYQAWYQAVKGALFNDDLQIESKKPMFPKDMRVAQLLKNVGSDQNHPDSQWVDNKKTPAKETLSQLVTAAFEQAWTKLEAEHGADPNKWVWQNWNRTQFHHLARLPGFGTEILPMDGSGDSVRGNRGWHGAVYKFVIELGPRLRAWIQVPGGNSGDPLSPEYVRHVREWAQGGMREVEYYQDIEEARDRAVSWVTFSPQKDL